MSAAAKVVRRRVAVVGPLAVLVLLILAPIALAAQSSNTWDRTLDPPEQDPASRPADQQPVAAEADDRCADVVGLPANIGCRIVQGGTNGLNSAASGLAGSVASSAFDSFARTVADGAVWFLSKIAALLDSSTRPAVTAPWFSEQYDTMVALTSVIVLPLVLVAMADAAVHGRPGQVIRTLFVYLPVAAIVTFVALELVDVALVVTDWASAVVSGGVAADTAGFLEEMGAILSGTVGEELPVFAVFIGGLFAVFAAFALWIELILRDAGINLAVLFLPLAFATMVWPRIARWASRALRTLAALILSKFFIVAVISLGASMLSGAGAGAGLETVIAGVALLAMASFAPWVLWGLLAPVEGAMDSALEGAARRPTAATSVASQPAAVASAPRIGGSAGGPLPVAGVTTAAAATAAVAGTGTEGSSGKAEALTAARANADAARRESSVASTAATGGGGASPPGGSSGAGSRPGGGFSPAGGGGVSSDGAGTGYGAGVDPDYAPSPPPSGVPSSRAGGVPVDARRPPPPAPAPAPASPAPAPAARPPQQSRPSGGRGA